MRKRQFPVHIWFLDNDLVKSAQMLTDRSLNKTIEGCIGALVAVHIHLSGIRSKKFYSHFFSKENVQETLLEKFPDWPLKKNPSFSSYSWKESKWCRACRENWNLVVEYLEALLDEHVWRHSSMHMQHDVLQWAQADSLVQDMLPYANLESVVLPWKAVDPKFRSVDIVEGYRKQYCATQIEDGDAFTAYARCKRDIPDFVVEAFSLNTSFER